MTKELAIRILRGDVLGTNEQTHEAVFMAIKALTEQARADAVEVVRCKNCIHLSGKDGDRYCYLDGRGITEEDYCSNGKTRIDRIKK